MCPGRPRRESRVAEAVRRDRALDLVGLALAGTAAGWTFVSAGRSGGEPTAVAVLFVVVGGATFGARLIAGRAGWPIPLAAVAAVGLSAVSNLGDLPTRHPLAGPLGYTNAGAALYLQGTAAALMLASRVRGTRRAGSVVAAVALGTAAALSGSRAVILLLPLPWAAWLLGRRDAARPVVAGMAGLLGLVLVATVALGATRGGADGPPAQSLEAVAEGRLAMWHDALMLMLDHPLAGVGPGRFEVESPIARSDPDVRWAHHGFLQQGAEAGVPGFALAVLFVAWGFMRLWFAGTDRATGLGAASLACLGAQACVDYVLHFPALPILAATLVGADAASGPGPGTSGSDEEVKRANELGRA